LYWRLWDMLLEYECITTHSRKTYSPC
jgi:hypothetical protein